MYIERSTKQIPFPSLDLSNGSYKLICGCCGEPNPSQTEQERSTLGDQLRLLGYSYRFSDAWLYSNDDGTKILQVEASVVRNIV
jgi:hypothetical protein